MLNATHLPAIRQLAACPDKQPLVNSGRRWPVTRQYFPILSSWQFNLGSIDPFQWHLCNYRIYCLYILFLSGIKLNYCSSINQYLLFYLPYFHSQVVNNKTFWKGNSVMRRRDDEQLYNCPFFYKYYAIQLSLLTA